MKKITKQNRERFFALYWGQCVGCDKTVQNCTVDDVYMNELRECEKYEPYYLSLKDVNNLTDEHVEELRDITSYCTDYDHVDPNIEAIINNLFYSDVISAEVVMEYTDFLRSKGYALPFMGITVEEMEKAGWIKIIE